MTLHTRRIRRGLVARTEFPLSHELKQTGDVHSKKQDVWVEYALKWAVRHASENGYGRVEWTTAGQQAARGNAGEAKGEVTFALDANGILSVSTRDTVTNASAETTIKADRGLADMVLVNNSRLSVQPVTDQEFERVREMAKGKIK